MAIYIYILLQAVEQIRIAEEEKITKEKIKEVEEEWQNNLLNWKSKRRQNKTPAEAEAEQREENNRRIRTFSQILNEKAKSGQTLAYNLQSYISSSNDDTDFLGHLGTCLNTYIYIYKDVHIFRYVPIYIN